MESKNKQTRGKRGSRQQKAILISFMEENLDFAHERFEGDHGASQNQRKWVDLSNQLNAIGDCSKTTEKWKQYWRDLKRVTKAKAAEEKRKLEESGRNGLVMAHRSKFKLDDLDKRIISIMTLDVVDGDGVSQERGLNIPTMSYTVEETFHISTLPIEIISAASTEPAQGTSKKRTKRPRESRTLLQNEPKLEAILAIEKEKLILEKEKFEFNKKIALENVEVKKKKVIALEGIQRMLAELVAKNN